jgi:phosphate transport system protein
MPTRQRYYEQLDKLQLHIKEMGAHVVKALEQAVRAYNAMDVRLAQEIVDHDSMINRLELDIDEECAILIAEESPVARDLRLILNAMRTSHTLERIADNAVHIAKSALRLAGENTIRTIAGMRELADIAVGMVRSSLEVFLSLDRARAEEIGRRDSQVDSIYARVFQDCTAAMKQDSSMISQALTLLFVCRRLERIADHATHICEGAIYVESGEYVDLNL